MNMNESAIITAPVRVRSDPAPNIELKIELTSERYIHAVMKIHRSRKDSLELKNAQGPKNLKHKSWKDFRITTPLKWEDQRLLDNELNQYHKDKKRKAEEDINDRSTKIAKLTELDLPPLSTDNWTEILSRFNNTNLLVASLVNRNFNGIARKLLFGSEVKVSHKKFHRTKVTQMPFVMQLRKLKFEDRYIYIDPQYRNDKYTQLLAQLTSLQSIKFFGDGLFIIPALKKLTQLTSLHLRISNTITVDTSGPSELTFDMFKELTDLSLDYVPGTLNGNLMPNQLTSLTLSSASITNLRNLTNLEHLCLLPHFQGVELTRKLINTDAFELPRLTSLKVTCTEIDFSKWTKLKALEHHEVNPDSSQPEMPLLLPPNLEKFTARFINRYLPVNIPKTVKQLSVGSIRDFMLHPVEDLCDWLRSIDMQCNITLLCLSFMDILEDIKTRPNLTLEMSTNSYSKEKMTNFFAGPLPQRLHLYFMSWNHCDWQPWVLEQIKELEGKTQLRVDFRETYQKKF